MTADNSGFQFDGKDLRDVHYNWVNGSFKQGRLPGPKLGRYVNKGVVRQRREMTYDQRSKKLAQTGTPEDVSITNMPVDPSKRPKTAPQIVIESAATGPAYDLIRYVYTKDPERGLRAKVSHLLLLCWRKKSDGSLGCTLEHYKTKGGEHLAKADNEPIELLPGDEKLPILQFTENDLARNGSASTEAIIKLDLNDLRKRIVIAAKAEKRMVDDQWVTEKPSPSPDSPGTEPDSSDQPKLAPKPGNPGNPSSGGLRESNSKQIQTAMYNLIHMLGLDTVYPKDRMDDIARKAAKNMIPALKELGLPDQAAGALLKVNLFETWFYCDDSGSMAGGRYRILCETVRRLAPIATKVVGNPVHLRFINNRNESLNNLNADSIADSIEAVRPGGGTPIGTNLASKIVKPLIERIKQRQLETPVVVTIITDGEPWGEDRDTLKNTVKECKEALQKCKFGGEGYGHSAVVFQIHYVGGEAEDYIEELEEEVGDIMFCNKQRLDDVIKSDDEVKSLNEQVC
ncbi:hypothetical protein EX30DRAFT_163592 [Ascodesmis nigricans]|uniref:VWFA domain-containing protein n=1 Tax=Ascodesmis nigricans TaxID=341454 RepID=A0A4S2MM76_9PEZI|nr:hypothetical protein EX30DRAFT_163592 [Ascodesmis nigricans]